MSSGGLQFSAAYTRSSPTEKHSDTGWSGFFRAEYTADFGQGSQNLAVSGGFSF